jgi:imidazolonepropionase-like amidohydrolase
MVGKQWLALFFIAALVALHAQEAPRHGQRPERLLIRNAMVVEGVGTPAFGPTDLLIEGNRIAAIGRTQTPPGAAVIDGTGRYVLPGLVNLHGHVQDERAGRRMDVNYCLRLWLAAGITTVRDVGSEFAKSKDLKAQSAAGTIPAPRLFLYPVLGRPRDAAAAVARVRELKEAGADGIKFLGIWRDTMEAMLKEARQAGLRTAHHAGVEETNAWDDARLGTTSIEHWYGIPDAALPDGVQNFPAAYSYTNEADRFRYAGRLWREADPARLGKVLDKLIEAGVAWDPTLNIYEASRDLQRAQNHPWFADYLHPALAKFFEPNLENHGSFFVNWTTEDEIYWRENYRLWMGALREFARRGGTIGTGEDAGYIYQVYGFGLIRELELHQEAGFHPLAVLRHATSNGARVLGKENEIGRLRAGWLADAVVVNGNPLENFKLLYPNSGRIEWTIKDGIPYRPPQLMAEVREIVKQARAAGP